MLTEQQIIELAKQSGILDEVQVGRESYYCFSDEEVYKFANALHDEFIKSLGEPVGFISKESIWRLKQGGNDSKGTVPIHANESRVSKTKLYALPNDEVKA
jgi:hypothetical protein